LEGGNPGAGAVAPPKARKPVKAGEEDRFFNLKLFNLN